MYRLIMIFLTFFTVVSAEVQAGAAHMVPLSSLAPEVSSAQGHARPNREGLTTFICALHEAARREAALSSQAGCESAGGEWMGEEAGRGRLTGCLMSTHDGGKPCANSSECESVCVDGQCHHKNQYKGCGIMMPGGAVLCVD